MGKRLRGSMSVYQETKKHEDFVIAEMLVISIIIGYSFGSWLVWLIAYLALAASLGTKFGLIIGWVITALWAVFIGFLSYVFSQSPEFSGVAAFLAGSISWYAHDCGNLYWRDFKEAQWW